ncbi:MAG: hypothetical protein PWP01_990 [Methanosarcinales archaeon]|nr:hypothetical protein [Methanosarcinales archaeon]
MTFRQTEQEGGCGVVGLISTMPIEARYLERALVQMHNRGNGKGGGIAAVGLDPSWLGVDEDMLRRDYIVTVAYLDPSARDEVEQELDAVFEIEHCKKLESGDAEEMGLDVRPPEVWLYMCTPRRGAVEQIEGLAGEKADDELVFRTSTSINRRFYANGVLRAFVLSHGKNMLILKAVGYAEHVIQYYKLEDLKAHVWLGHQRYPTRGRVWHPGGAHPFMAMHEALVHNGDLANYSSLASYLSEYGYEPMFLTDTEAGALLFDLYTRKLEYPLEYTIEAIAPTTERDIELLPVEKRRLYRTIQALHVHASPDGPWFFILARNIPARNEMQLIGITDTSMLRPQVFALQQREHTIALIASEKQAIDAVLGELAAHKKGFDEVADRYWNARGGSYTDGGAFIFTLRDGVLEATNKFGAPVDMDTLPYTCEGTFTDEDALRIQQLAQKGDGKALFSWMVDNIGRLDIEAALEHLISCDGSLEALIHCLTLMLDRRYDPVSVRRSVVLSRVQRALNKLLASCPYVGSSERYVLVDAPHREDLCAPLNEQVLVVDAAGFAQEGEHSVARFIVDAYRMGWREFIVFNTRGHRFIGCGLGPNSHGVRIDVYGSSGDYLGSGMDGAEVYVHGSAQDQVAQIIKSGKLVIHGDVGQTFMYGAKGAEVYVLGNAAGRPLINAVGSPRAVINGTCLDYLAESMMAGNPLSGGGFVIVNGVSFDERGNIIDLEEPYPGGNLFSLASGGAVYIRDPMEKLDEGQLNGGRFAELGERDWKLIEPYLRENERLFGIPVERLLTVNGKKMSPYEVYRKVEAVPVKALAALGA